MPQEADPYRPSPKTLHQLDELMQSYLQSEQVAHISFAIWQHGALKKSGYFGARGSPDEASVSEATIHRIYSMTKPVTAVALLILMERGYFHLDDPISDVLPELAGLEVIADYGQTGEWYTYRSVHQATFRDLLSHTAGFAYDRLNQTPLGAKYHALEITLSPDGDTLVSRLSELPLMRAPGAEWNYSIASDLQGIIIERLTGEPLDQFLEREIFARLHMQDTGFYLPPHKLDRVSAVSERSQGGLHQNPESDLSEAAQRRTYFEGGHGLVSTIADYHRFLEMLRRGGRAGPIRILEPETVALLCTNRLLYRGAPAPRRGYGRSSGLGFGFGVGTIESPQRARLAAPAGTYYWHVTLGTWFWVDPDNDIIFIGMAQSHSPVTPDGMKASMEIVYSNLDSNSDD